jgi:twinkle protein
MTAAVNSSNEITHQPCPYEDCASSDAFAYNVVSKLGKCHSCNRAYPGKDKKFSWAEGTYPPPPPKVDLRNTKIISGRFNDIRGLDEDVAKLYNIQLQYGENNTPVRYAFKYPNNVKYRGFAEKKFWTKERGAPTDLFGPDFNAGSSKRIYITEGEFDAASLYQVLGKSYPVKSLPSASLSEKFIKDNFDYLNAFEMVVYAGELDAAGKGAAQKLYSMMPDKFYYVPMSKWKDANEFLTEGDGDDLKWAALKPQRYSPDNFFVGDLEVEKAITTENPYEYVPTGHTGLDDKLRGLVKGGLTFIKALRGQGKTELVRYFEVALLKQQTRVALLHMEEMKSTTYRAMATYELGWNVRTKEDAIATGFTEEQVIAAAQKMAGGESTIIFEMQSHDDPMQLLEYVRLASTVYGAEYIFIDHVQRLAYLSNSGVDAATSTLTTLGSRMAQLAKELNIGVVFISQVNEDGRTKYAASLEEEAIICIKLQRDTESDDEIVRNTTQFIVDKNRPFAKLGNAGSVYYDPETTILEEAVFQG